ncbi:MAG: guanylate kinase [Candidatus Gastranaerophilales bacterium]|nr:guanylate kinase [Candidatus Gastranaerophilales bacterium]
MKGHLYIISGCSGVGKGTLLKLFLQKNPEVKLSISATTRLPRENEKDGINYFFISKEEFLSEVNNNEFLEWAEFSGNYYGTKKSFVEKTLNEGNDLILEIEVQGAKQVKTKMPEAITIFIMPPSVDTLEERLRGRHTEDEETIQKRLHEANREIEAGKNFDYKIINDNLDDALINLQKIFNKERSNSKC